MEKERLEKANDLKREIESLELISKLLNDEQIKKNPHLHFGIGRDEYSSHYYDLKHNDLTSQLVDVTKRYVSEKLPKLQKEFSEL